MSECPGYVFDASVIVSALLFEHSPPGRAFYGALRHGNILLSADVVDELSAVLRRPKFDRYLRPEGRDAFLLTLMRDAMLVQVSEVVRTCRDPKDDKYLALAAVGRAVCIISGDEDLRCSRRSEASQSLPRRVSSRRLGPARSGGARGAEGSSRGHSSLWNIVAGCRISAVLRSGS